MSDIPNNIDTAKTVVDEFVGNKRQTLQSDATEQAGAQVAQEVDRLTKYYDYRERVAQDKLDNARNTLERQRKELVGVQRNILPVTEAQVRDREAILTTLTEERKRRIAEAEKFRYPAVADSLKSLGRIEVVGGMDA